MANESSNPRAEARICRLLAKLIRGRLSGMNTPLQTAFTGIADDAEVAAVALEKEAGALPVKPAPLAPAAIGPAIVAEKGA